MQDSCLVSEPTSLCQDQLQRTQKQKVSIHIVNCTIDIIMSSKYQKMKLASKPSSPSGQSLHFLLFLLSASWDAICGMIILHSIKIVTPICSLVSCPETHNSDQYTQAFSQIGILWMATYQRKLFLID